jgi:hypothetical protein
VAGLHGLDAERTLRMLFKVFLKSKDVNVKHIAGLRLTEKDLVDGELN